MTGAPLAPTTGRQEFRVAADDGDRLDVFVARCLDVSRTYAATLIANRHVLVDGKHERASFRAPAGATIVVDVPPPARRRDVVAETIPIDVVFEDEHLLVIDKPAGMVVHPAPGHWSGTLVNALMGRGSALAGGADATRAGLVHRLDRDTSGLLIVAKTDLAHRRLTADLAARRITRRYAALCAGHLGADSRRVDAPLARDAKDRRKVAVVAGGRRAVTDFVRIARFSATDLLRAHLHSGEIIMQIRTRSVGDVHILRNLIYLRGGGHGSRRGRARHGQIAPG